MSGGDRGSQVARRGWLNVVAGAPLDAPGGVGGGDRLRGQVERFATVWVGLALIADIIFRGVPFISLINLSTLLSSAVSTVRRTTAFAVTAVFLTAVSPVWTTGQSSTTQYLRVLNTTLVGSAAILIAVLRTRREAQLLHIVAAAEAAQRAVLPTLPGQVGTVAVAARYHSAANEAMVGGDVFDMYYNDTGKVIALVGDVAGHGLGSVEEGARLIRAFRQYAPTSETLEQLAALMNAYITPFLAPEAFVTAVLVDVSSPQHITVASCGHPAPLLVTTGGIVELSVDHGLPLGLGAPVGTRTHPWSPGDRLLLHTDGLLEARDKERHFLSVIRLEAALRAATPEAAVDATIAVLEGFVGHKGLPDDVCLMLIENRGTAAPAPQPEPAPAVNAEVPLATELR